MKPGFLEYRRLLSLILLGASFAATIIRLATGRAPDVASLGFDRLGEVMADGLIVVDALGYITYINPSGQRILGRSPQALPLPAFHALAHIPKLKALSDGSAVEAELAIGEADNLRFYEAYASPLTDHRLHMLGRAIVVHDVTQRRQAQEMLRDSEERYRSIFLNSIDGIFLTDPDGACFAANPAICQMLGQTEEELKRVGRLGVVDVSDPRFSVILEDRQRTGKSRGELTYLHKDGTPFPVEISTALFKDRKGIDRAVIIVRDITRRKHAEKRLLDHQRALAVMEERERVARELHDDVGQVLAFVNTQAQAVRELLALGQADASIVHVERLIKVVQGAQGDVREQILSMNAQVSLEQGMVATLEDYLSRFGRNAGLETTLVVPTDLQTHIFGPAVEVQVLRIVQEALANVRKHAQASRVMVTFAVEDDQVQIAVADDGRGFDPKQVAGAGQTFGLRIMEERAREVDGFLSLESAPGLGTTLLLKVPPRETTRHLEEIQGSSKIT